MTHLLRTFKKGGIHPRDKKHLTENLEIETFPAPEEVDILLSQHFGSPCDPVVKKKSVVMEGEMIGEIKEGLGAPIHASVSGKVKSVGSSAHPVSINSASVTILTDPEAEAAVYEPREWSDMGREEILGEIKKAGIVGIGGAGFPTHVKLAPPPEASVDTLILNGAECEPYLTTDHRLMIEKSEEIIEGALILMKALGIGTCFVGIEENKPEAIKSMEAASGAVSNQGAQISIVPLKVKYPQGSEKQLIESITGRRVPGFGLPFDVGVVVQNTGTVFAAREAVVLDKPLYEKVITISGSGIERPANLLVKIGTRLKDIVDYLGGTKEGLSRVVMGGPMMGHALPSLDIPVTKTTSGVLFLSEEETDNFAHSQCIRCGWCMDACPMGLSPYEIGIYAEAGRGAETSRFGVFECFECGSCAFVCPAKRPLVQFVRMAKNEAGKRG